jgi:hypothetical protein
MVLTMTEPQVWALIGVFAAALFGMFTIVSTLFVRVIRAEIGGLRSEFNGQFTGIRSEFNGQFTGLRGEFDGFRGEMNARFDTLEQRVDGLDRDVQALVKHTFGLDRG